MTVQLIPLEVITVFTVKMLVCGVLLGQIAFMETSGYKEAQSLVVAWRFVGVMPGQQCVIVDGLSMMPE